MSYKRNKAWRLKNTEKRNIQRKKYYNRFSSGNWRHRKRWDLTEILSLSLPFGDVYLHNVLGRSVQAIQIMRCRLAKELK